MGRSAGRPRKDFGHEEKAEFLALRRSGEGVNRALLMMGVGRGRLDRAMRDDPAFRSEAQAAAASLVDALVKLRLDAAMAGDPKAQEFLINRHDKARRFAASLAVKRMDARRRRPDGAGDGAGTETARRLDAIIEAVSDRPASR